MGEKPIRWRCGCKDADHCESPAKACQKVQRLEDAVGTMLAAFDPEWPGACPQECFDTSDGHGYERQEAAIRLARAALDAA